MPVLASSLRKPEPTKPSPRMPVDKYGASLGKAERIGPPRFKDWLMRKTEDLVARLTGLGPGEVTEEDAAMDSLTAGINPLAMGIIKPGQHYKFVERLLDQGIDPILKGTRRSIIERAVTRNPRVSAHIDQIRQTSLPWYPSHVAPSDRRFGKDWTPMQKYIEDLKKNPPLPGMEEPILDVEFSPTVSDMELPRVAGHEFNHAAQVIRNPKGFGYPAKQFVLGNTPGPDVYGHAQFRNVNPFTNQPHFGYQPIDWQFRPEELAAEVAGWKRAGMGRPPAAGVSYAERLTEAINKLPESMRDGLVRGLGAHGNLNQPQVNPDLIDLWNRYFNRGGNQFFDLGAMKPMAGTNLLSFQK